MRWPRPPCWPILALLLAYGVATETLQLFVPGRTAQVVDAAENILGIAIASGVYWSVQRLAAPPKKVLLAAALVKWAAGKDAEDR